MLTLEVAVECEKCGLYLDAYDCHDGMDVDNFLMSVSDWSDDYSRCPHCQPEKYTCTWCGDSTETFEDSEWMQFVAADMLTLITLCNHCSQKREYIRS
jgi:CRISPR/Cas system-associated protein Cas10 (large subunit of type III CRISPR-Cas system)